MRVAVTGGAGFIGANLCKRLLEEQMGIVAVVDDLSTGRRANLDDVGVAFVEGSILDDDALDDAFAGADAVVHLAALGSVPRSVADPMTSLQVNAVGTAKVMEAARRHGDLHVVVAGSSSVYGSNPILPKHEDLATRPLSPYGVSKLSTEATALAWSASYGLPTLAFRFFNVFGPLQPARHAYAAVIPAFVDAALRGEPVTVHGDGTQSRDFTYVDTVTGTIVEALRARTTSDTPVNLAFGSRISLLEVLDQLEAILGRPVQRRHIEPRAGDVPHSQADNSRLTTLFPALHPTPFPDGLTATVDWMRGVVTSTDD